MRLSARKAAIQRRVVVRKHEVDMAGLLPMVERAAAMNRMRLSATVRADALSGSS
jgi:hypothetical protein